MGGVFTYEKFSDINLDDSFFDSLKADYPGTETSTEFCTWFGRKADSGEQALVYRDDDRLCAFVYIKKENEGIALSNGTKLEARERIKLGTLKISDLHRGQRIGEGAVGIALWEWQKSRVEEIFVTVFSKHEKLIELIQRFGFKKVGENLNGENVYLKSRKNLSYENPYLSFPFVSSKIKKAGYLFFEDTYHDTMFPYSEIKNVERKSIELSVANGMSKIYVSEALNIKYEVGEPVLIYRKYNGEGVKKYKSCVTSFCMVTGVLQAKKWGRKLYGFEELLNKIGNKSVFNPDELRDRFDTAKNIIIYELLYYAYFGEGNNVNYAWLKEHQLWAKEGEYPADRELTPEEFIYILKEGNLDVQNIIIN